jgi:hypothetical protein
VAGLGCLGHLRQRGRWSGSGNGSNSGGTQESPSIELRTAVVDWIATRYEDPYQGVARQAGFDNLWWGPVPRTYRAGAVVTCSYWIIERDGVVRCDLFGTHNVPR